MKLSVLVLIILAPFLGISQATLSMNEVEGLQELSMADATGKRSDGLYRYYAKGSSTPFTGILYSKYPNGQTNSWQHFEDGVGQGEWINYYENGNYKEVGNYEQNRVEGPIKKYHPNGQLQAEGIYKEWRVRVGEWKYYDDKGVLINTEDYGAKGNLDEVTAYYKRGEISYQWYTDIKTKNGFE